jgi:methionine synthase / methylenetetrahydrofolate reductase(NADPH)
MRNENAMSNHPFLQRLAETPLLTDGAMGTMLYARGASSEQCLEYLVLSKPAWVSEIHQAYASAGADIIKTHTFGANRIRLADYGLADKVRDLNFRAVKLVRDVREVSGRALFIAGDAGPLGRRLQPEGPLSEDEAREAFHEQVSVLWEAGADLLLFETFVHLSELEIAIQVAGEVCDLPIVASMTFAEDGLTMTGHTPGEVVARLRAAGADVVGVNCSVGPTAMLQTLEQMHGAGDDTALIVMPNAGFPQRVEGRFYYPSSPEYFCAPDRYISGSGCAHRRRLLRHDAHAYPRHAVGAR